MNISFIMPAYNYSQYVSYAIGSIMDRNFEDGDELVVCDDASTDDTVVVVEQMRDRWPHIRVVTHEQNRGGGAARNTAIRNSSNEIIFCLDADNVLEPKSVPRLKQFMLDKRADVAAFRELRYFGSAPKTVVWPMDVVVLEHYLRRASVPGSSGNYMYTRASWERVGGLPKKTTVARPPWGFGFRQAAHGSRILVAPFGGYFHRRGHHSYYMRGLDEGTLSEAAMPILQEFLYLLDEQDADYILNNDNWFERMKERPLRLRDDLTNP